MEKTIKEKIRARKIFNQISPIYSILHKSIVANFSNAANEINQSINLSGKRILDIGTGTGAWSYALLINGAESIHGIDISEKMIKQANKRKHPKLSFNTGDAERLNRFEDNSFDIVTASFVLHGFEKGYRLNVLNEMKRVSKDLVILHDYSGRTPLFQRFLEYLEKSDYINFKSGICDELKSLFKSVTKKQINSGTALYFSHL